MDLLSPLQLAWLGLLGPLVILYILKRRRQVREIGSTLLWEAALRDLRAERPWKRLVPHLSLLLQALVIVAGAIALARPAGAGRVPRGARIAVVVDTSASMAAKDSGRGNATRMDRARDVARSIARSLPPGGEMMLIEAGTDPVVLAAPTRDAAALERAIDGLVVRGGGADIEAAAGLASERLRDGPSGSRVLVLTDAAMDAHIALDGRSVPVEVRKVGGESDNTAIVALDVRARPTEDAPDRADVFARVARYGARAVDLYVSARTEIDGQRSGIIASRRVRVEPGHTEGVVMSADLPPDRHGRAAVVRVEIAPAGAGAGADALALDDVAVAPSPGGRKLPVFLVGAAPDSVARVLRADDALELYRTTLAQLAERADDEPPLDGLFVYAGETPPRAPPGDSVVVAPSGARVFEVALGEEVRGASVVTWDETDPRLRFVTMTDAHFGAIRPVHGAAARPLVTTEQNRVAIASLVRPDGETTLVALDPDRGDWPTKSSFVVFFRNVLERARDRRAAGGIAPGKLGEALRVPAPEGERVTVTSPSGARATGASRGGVAIVPVPAEPGIYRAQTGDRRLHALRNLLDANESDIRPRARFTLGGRRTAVTAADATEHHEIWPWLVALLLLFFVADALWATRKGAA